MHGVKEAKQGSLKGDFYCFLLKCIIIVRAWGQSIHVTACMWSSRDSFCVGSRTELRLAGSHSRLTQRAHTVGRAIVPALLFGFNIPYRNESHLWALDGTGHHHGSCH